ncbi:MAG TPA: stalk domain-containing protein [Symbiobacteriaceae bacterium]|nr:stalk domain-containing protein [Symbiobacteriaceae bacterium]
MRLRKALASFLLAALTTALAAPAAFGADGPAIYLNGRPLSLTAPAVLVQDRTLVPVRSFMEALGAKVLWQPPDTVTIQWEDRTVTLRIGDTQARVGTTTVSMDVPAQLINSTTYVPLRFVSEALGAEVAFDGAVRITAPIGSRVVFDGPLNVRSAAYMSAPVLMTVPVGTRFSVLSSDIQWTQVMLPRGQTGWVASRYTERLPERPPIDLFADMLTGPTGYLQVQSKCLGAAPILSNSLHAPLEPAVTALGGTVAEGTVRLGSKTWQVPQEQLVTIGSEAFLPVRSLAQGLGLSLSWDDPRRTAVLGGSGGTVACNPSSTAAVAYLIMDGRSGLVLSEQRADAARPVASITKIMTGLLAVERGNPASIITTSRNAAGQIGTRMGLRAGDQIRLGDMIYGLMLPSGNDAATAIGEHLSGSEPAFAAQMTRRAAELGAVNTLFYNASGLDDWVRPYSSARDMALIAREAMKNPEFRAVASREEYRFNGPRGPWVLQNKNDFVGTYTGATGVKNGWTEIAGHTLVASAYRDGVELLVVVLGANVRGDLYVEARRLMDAGFKLAGDAWLLQP